MAHPYYQLGEEVLFNISEEFGEYFYYVKFLVENPKVKTFTRYHSSELTKTFHTATLCYDELMKTLGEC